MSSTYSWRDAFSWRVLILALLFTLLNVPKPLAVDDPTYFRFAQQIAHDPLDPYGCTYFWYEEPQQANDILAPAVFLYYLAGVMTLAGESVLVLKLALLPWSWLLVVGLDRLLTRFALGQRWPFLIAGVLSPVLVPAYNLMLDIPALALTLLAIDLFLSVQDHPTWLGAVGVGVLAALAMQTKYTAFVLPPALLWAACLRGRWRLAITSVGVAIALFVGWEVLMYLKYGQSHFMAAAGGDGDDLGLLGRSLRLVPFFLTYLGGLGCVVLLLGLWCLSVPRGVIVATAVALVGLHLVILLFDARLMNDTRLSPLLFGPSKGLREVIQPSEPVFIVLGLAVLVMAGWVAFSLCKDAPTERVALLFLVGWLVIESGASLALSPFPAGRRLCGVLSVVLLLIAWRATQAPAQQVGLWVLVTAQVLLALGYAALDVYGAWVPQAGARQAAAWIADQPGPSGKVWFVGHLGFQVHAQQVGMVQLAWQPHFRTDPERVEAGDWIVVPDTRIDQQSVRLDGEPVELRHTLAIPAMLPIRTMPCYHGGRIPLEHFEGHALEVRIWQARAAFVPRYGPPVAFHEGY